MNQIEERKMPVVARYVDMDHKWYLCHASSYQNAFRSEANGFATRGEAVQFAEQAGCAVEHHEYDQLQQIHADRQVTAVRSYSFYKMSLSQAGARLFKIVAGSPGPQDHLRVARACMTAATVDDAKLAATPHVEFQVDVDDAFNFIHSCMNGHIPLSAEEVQQLVQ